jgi:hypothetical protein
MSAPVTPCGPEATVAFVERRFGEAVAKLLDPAARVARVRQARIVELRRCGELRHAERYGWLSLTAWLLGMKVATVRDLDPTSAAAITHRADGNDMLADPLGADPEPQLTTVTGTDLEASDPRDAFGFGVFALAGTALRDGVAEVDGRRIGGGAVTASLKARLEEVARG